MADILEHVLCPLCDANDAPVRCHVRDHIFGEPDDFTLVTCRVCGLTYLNPRPTLEGLHRFYPDNYFCYHPVLRDGQSPQRSMGGLVAALTHRRIAQLERVVGRIPSTAHILDVGCGANAFLYHLNRIRGCRTLGIDFSAPVVGAIRQRLNMPAMHGSLLDCGLQAGSFDGVAMYEYLEHEGRPREILAETRRLTRPGGWLVAEIPNIGSPLARLFGRKWCQLDTPRHLVLYDRNTVATMLRRSGYEVIAVKRLWYQWMIGFSILVAAGFRTMGRHEALALTLGVAATLPFLPVPWICPEFLRVYARVV